MSTFIKKNLFEIIFIPLMLGALISASVIFNSPFLVLICTIVGLMGSVLNGKGRVLCYFFALTSSIAYGIISLRANYLGEVILHFGFLTPLYLLSIIRWCAPKRKRTTNQQSPMFKLNSANAVAIIVTSIIAIIIYGIILKFAIRSAFPFLNAASTVIILMANYLGAKRKREQWLAHILGNVIVITLWALSEDKGNYPILIQNALFVVCNIRGIIVWNKQLKKIYAKPIEPNDA